jgi:AcrR family transcriptional regulator
MAFRAVPALRHVPKQSRGERRVDQILRSAEVIFAEVGYEHATTNAVAVHAGISIGSLYQFFGSKEAIFEAMAQRYLEQTRQALVIILDPQGEFDVRVLIKSLLARLVELQEQRPFFLQCLSGNSTYSAIQGPVNDLNSAMTKYVAALLRRVMVPMESPDIARKASVCVHLVSSLLPLAMAARGKRRQRMVDEISLVLERYLAPELKPGTNH